MAQLFQPTNITPDLRGSFGNGVANLYYDLPVSWQVNGNTAMTAFEITFYKNDGSGDQLYTTGQLTDGCPFYGLDSNGNIQLFTYTVSGAEIYNAGMRNGREYQMKITQYWGAIQTGVVEQISPSIFLTRFSPALGIRNADGTAVGTTITTRSVTMVFGHSNQSSSGSLLWIRWMLRNSEGTILKDTGKLYGSVDPTFSYDGLLPGQYAVQFSCETEFGVPDSVPWTEFPVSYSTSTSGIPVVASRACNGESAVSVRWSRLQSIPLIDSSGDTTDNAKAITLPSTSSFLMWDTVNNDPMAFQGPWSAMWSGSVTTDTRKLFTLTGENGEKIEVGMAFDEVEEKGSVYLTWEVGTMIATYAHEVEWAPGPVFCCLTQGYLYWQLQAGDRVRLYPLETLYPENTLYPGGLENIRTERFTMSLPSLDLNSVTIASVELHGPATLYGFELLDHNMEGTEVYGYMDGTSNMGYNMDYLFYIGPRGVGQTYNAGNYPSDLQGATLVSIYRKTGDSGVLEYVGQTNVGAGNTIMDYAARSQQGPYTYYLYVLSADKYINVPSVSNSVDPCFWNWSVLSCTENADGSFTVQSSYLFGKNLQSGNMANNNQPGIFKNFTPYPTVMIAPQNYRSGTLQSLIGVISEGKYSDTIAVRDAIYALSTTTNVLFLKDRKGDLFRIRPSGEIGMETMDNTAEQAQNVSFPWVEVGDASEAAVYNLGDAS